MTRRAANVRDVHRPIPNVCAGCHEGLAPDVLPMDVTEDDGDGRGRIERWCPQCFVSIRARLDARWSVAVHVGQILAIRCLACGKTSVDFGAKACGQCRSRQIVMLLPKGTVLKAGALRAAGLA